MSDVTAQEFREAGALEAASARMSEDCLDAQCEACEAATVHRMRARLFLAGAEYCAQVAAVRELLADRGIVNDSSAYELRDLILEALAAKGSRL